MLTSSEVKKLGRAAGFDMVRIGAPEPFPQHGAAVEERKARGWLPPEMEATYAAIGEARCASEPSCVLPEVRSIISLGLGYYLRGDPDRSSPGKPCGRLPRNEWRDVYREAARRRDAFVQDLSARGAKCAPAGRLSAKRAAERTGLAGYAKSGLTHAEVHGPWFVLATVVTDLTLETDRGVEINCGSCRRCVDACPTKAIREPYVVDGSRCLVHLLASKEWVPRELRGAVANRINSCDQCIEVCPRALNPLVSEDRLPDPLGRWTHSPELLPLLNITEEEFRDHFAHLDWYSADKLPLVRNAIVALGNSGDLSAIPALAAMLENDEAMLRGHAAWALGRLGGDDARSALSTRLEKETDGRVREEIEAALLSSRP